MSESENVAFVRATIEAFNRGDLEWLMERIDEDFEFDWTRSRGPLAGLYRGPEGLAEFVREQWDTFETFHMEPLEFIDRGRFVVVPNRVSAQGRRSPRSRPSAAGVSSLPIHWDRIGQSPASPAARNWARTSRSRRPSATPQKDQPFVARPRRCFPAPDGEPKLFPSSSSRPSG